MCFVVCCIVVSCMCAVCVCVVSWLRCLCVSRGRPPAVYFNVEIDIRDLFASSLVFRWCSSFQRCRDYNVYSSRFVRVILAQGPR